MPSFDSPVIVWVIVAVAAGIVEVSIPHFGLIFVSLAAVASAVAASFGVGTPLQLIVFVIILGVSWFTIRPRLTSRNVAPGVPSRTDALLQKEGVVTHDIDPVLGAGRVNVGGQDWAARSKAPLATGTRIRVVGADGITLEVTPV